MLKLLAETGKTKYSVDGLGTASVVLKKNTRVPKDFDSKKSMIDFFHAMGEDAYYSFVSVNSMTLNSFINEQTQSDPDFKVPGVFQEISSELRFTKEKRK